MSYRSQNRKGASRKFTKSPRERKSKEKKPRKAAKYVEQPPETTAQEAADKTLNALNRLGNQIFALSPFSQYFDDWLVNLRQVVSEFESNQAVKVDEQFQKERTQVFLDLQATLAENRLAESRLTEQAKALADTNHKIVEADKQYAEQTRDLSNKRNSELQRLSSKVHQLEDDLARQQQVKIGFFQFGEKKRAAEKLAQTNRDLTSAKNELEVTIQNFTAEQEKLHDSYQKRRQGFHEASDRLHKELEELETDTSKTARQAACNALAEAINGFLKRAPPTSAT